MIQVEEKRKTRFKYTTWELYDSFRKGNMWIMGIPEGKERDKQIQYLFKEITKNFPSLGKKMYKHILSDNKINKSEETYTIPAKFSTFIYREY